MIGSRRQPSAESAIVTVLISALLAITSVSIDIALPALPSISRAFRGDAGHAQLVVALFLVGFAFGQLVYGPLSDRWGRRAVLLGALALYLAAAVACAAAPSLEWLIVARLLQGFGACAGPVIARAIVRDVYDPLRGARVLSLAMLGMSLGPITGAMVGGGVVFAFHWRGSSWCCPYSARCCCSPRRRCSRRQTPVPDIRAASPVPSTTIGCS